MSRNHGRRIIDTVRNEDLREKTRSELYDIIAEMIRRAPDEARDMGYALISKKQALRREDARALDERLARVVAPCREARQ